MYGSGPYSLSSVMEIDGTTEYLRVAEELGKCQNKESQEDCQTREYLTQGIQQCNCIPYKLRNYSKDVSVILTFC